jgi:C-terminal processing protease CtpA/Prc
MELLKLGTLFFMAAAAGSAATLMVEGRLGGTSRTDPAIATSADDEFLRLRTQLNDEIEARVALENYVYQGDSASSSQEPSGAAATLDATQAAAELVDADNARPFFNERIQEMMRRRQRSNIKSRLIESGFGEDEAERILQRQAEIDLARLYEDYEERRARALESPSNPSGRQQLRTELGDEAYERYLESLGRPTKVPIRMLLQPSPGATAGLQAGDRVVAYNGERVFSMQDLNSLTVQGNPGESVVMEVERDGDNVAIVIPRGPIGFSSGPFRRR